MLYLKVRFSALPGEQLTKKRELLKKLEGYNMAKMRIRDFDMFNIGFHERVRNYKRAGGELAGEEEALIYWEAISMNVMLGNETRFVRASKDCSCAMEVQLLVKQFLIGNPNIVTRDSGYESATPSTDNEGDPRRFQQSYETGKRKDSTVLMAADVKKTRYEDDVKYENGEKYETVTDKFKLCSFFASKRGCIKGDQCRFVHIKPDMIPTGYDWNLYCHQMVLTGRCIHGNQCRFAHLHNASKNKFEERA
jgi:hypothetical protein